MQFLIVSAISALIILCCGELNEEFEKLKLVSKRENNIDPGDKFHIPFSAHMQ
jgi:hypothetical protein